MDRAMTVRHVAAEYGVTPDTVYGWLRDGRLDGMKLPGGEWRFRRTHLEEFDKQCRDRSLKYQTTASASVKTDGSSTGPKTASRDPFRLGRLNARRQSGGATNG